VTSCLQRCESLRTLPGWRPVLCGVAIAWFAGCGLSPALCAEDAKRSPKKVIAVGVDYNDQVVIGYEEGYLYDEPRIRQLIRAIKSAGTNEVYWRVSLIGKVTYRSKVMPVMDGKGAPYPGAAPTGIILKQCDPLAVAIDECHKQGMKCFAYMTLFDFAYPGFENDFFERHPEYWSRLAGVLADNVRTPLPGAKEAAEFSKTVKTGGYSKSLEEGQRQATAPYVRGVPSYGYPKARQYVLAQVSELIGYKPDGIYFDVARTHAGIYPVLSYGWAPQWQHPYLKYGYNEPEIALYLQRHGKFPPLRDVTSLQSLDETEEERNWNAVRGHFLTVFLREAARLAHEAHMEVAVAFYSDTQNGFQPGTHTRQQLGRYEIQWRAWCDQRLVDVIRLIVGHRKHGYDDWVQSAAETYKYAQDRGVRVYCDCAIEGKWDRLKDPPAPLPITETGQPDLYFRVLGDATRKILSSSADGIYYYEAGANGPRTWNTILKAAAR